MYLHCNTNPQFSRDGFLVKSGKTSKNKSTFKKREKGREFLSSKHLYHNYNNLCEKHEHHAYISSLFKFLDDLLSKWFKWAYLQKKMVVLVVTSILQETTIKNLTLRQNNVFEYTGSGH